ncbi:MAG: hypothetical protein HFJ41_00150 [Clostridia bacterium]|nr:hypothetical protein [Clostridia bacterium]
MEYVFILIGCLTIIGVLYMAFDINIKKIKQYTKKNDLDEITNKFPENKEICEAILKKLKNEKVKIKENEDKNNKTSLYVAISDTIFIANIKESFTRIQTIAHECIHSVQSRRLLLFNFIYSNIYMLYFGISLILTIFGIIKNTYIQIIILILMSFIYYIIRSYLETDAMIKARYVAEDYMKEYIKKERVCTEEDIEKICNKYDEINPIGIPTYNFILVVNWIVKVMVYTLIVIIRSIFI